MPSCPCPVAVDPTGRRLLDSSGKPFFYLADTAWELVHRLTMDEIDSFLRTRARQRFNAIQFVLLAEFDGLNAPSRQGERPLIDNDPAKPNERYFAFVDEAVNRMNELGLVAVMLPTWGDKVPGSTWGIGPKVFTPENATIYGEWLGRRYRNAAVVWMNGGDRPILDERQRLIWRNLALGLRATSDHLITFHPTGRTSSSACVHDEAWLAFNTIQTGHRGWDFPIEKQVTHDLSIEPHKPTINSEPCYEDHPVMSAGWKPAGGWFNDADVRDAAYRSVFSGAAGHTYGCHDVWQFYDPKRGPAHNHARTPWQTAVDLPGANQMRHLRALIELESAWESVSYAINADCPPTLRATRGRQITYLAADAVETWVRPNLEQLGALDSSKMARWFDPRTGEYRSVGDSRIIPPDPMLDWILEIIPK
jgi:hypothetical protein